MREWGKSSGIKDTGWESRRVICIPLTLLLSSSIVYLGFPPSDLDSALLSLSFLLPLSFTFSFYLAN